MILYHGTNQDIESIDLTHQQKAEYLIAYVIDEVVLMLVQNRQLSLEQALDMFYGSHTLELLQRIDGELYVQSPAYVYELLNKELSAVA